MFGFLKKRAEPAPTLRAELLQPRIKHLAFARTLHERGVPSEQMPPMQRLCGELIVTYAFDLPDALTIATPGLLADVGVTVDDLPDIAMSNLLRALPQPEFIFEDGVNLIRTGGDVEATLLIVGGLWDLVQPQLSGPILATAPRRDRLLICDGADAAAIDALHRKTMKYFGERDDQHRLSTQTMVRRDGAWTVWNEH